MPSRRLRVSLFFFSNTALVAKEAEFKLCLAGLNAKTLTDIPLMHMQAENLQKRIWQFYRPVSPYEGYLPRFEHLSGAKCKIMVITSYDSPKLNDLVDYKFITSDKITAQNSVSLSNNLMFLYVWDVIYAFLLDSDKRLRQKKLNNESIINNNQMLDNYMFEY